VIALNAQLGERLLKSLGCEGDPLGIITRSVKPDDHPWGCEYVAVAVRLDRLGMSGAAKVRHQDTAEDCR